MFIFRSGVVFVKDTKSSLFLSFYLFILSLSYLSPFIYLCFGQYTSHFYIMYWSSLLEIIYWVMSIFNWANLNVCPVMNQVGFLAFIKSICSLTLFLGCIWTYWHFSKAILYLSPQPQVWFSIPTNYWEKFIIMPSANSHLQLLLCLN